MTNQIVRNEWHWVLVFSLGLILLTGVPYLIGAANPGGAFSGFIYGVEDGNSYIAKMLSGAQGAWLFRSPYSAVEQGGALLYLPYLLIGKLFGPSATHGQLVWALHIFRSLSLLALCFATYAFISHFIREANLRRLGLALAALGGGLGWVLLLFRIPDLFGSIPLEFYSPETFGFLANFTIPHLVLARALVLWGLLIYLRAPAAGAKPWLSVLIWLAMALCHPITAALGLALIAMHLIFRFISDRLWRKISFAAIWDLIEKAIWPIVGAAPALLANLLLYRGDTYLHTWAAQNQILSPNILHYVVAYGWVLPFVYFGLRAMLKTKGTGDFLLVWLVALPIFIYTPLGLQRRLAEGAWVMLIVLALFAFDQGVLKKSWRDLWVFSLAFPSTLLLLLGTLPLVSTPAVPVFLPADEAEAFTQLRGLAQPGEIVLAGYDTGNALPAWAPLRVLVGHGPESANLSELMPTVQGFYQGRTSDEFRIKFLQRHSIDYVFWGATERSFGSWQPVDASYLERVVQIGEYEIYRVVDEALE